MTPRALTALIDATWPAARARDVNGWTIRAGTGAGSRVNAATAAGGRTDFKMAEAAMRDTGQTPLFMVRSGETELDARLRDAGYAVKDPTTLYTAPIDTIGAHRPPPVSCFEVWPPLAIQIDIWARGGIDDARLAIMHRAPGPKVSVLGRADDAPAGSAFAAIHDDTVMLHAIETAAAFRRRGVARNMMRALAVWAGARGARTVALLVTQANVGANALYSSLGMVAVGGYHYRIAPEGST